MKLKEPPVGCDGPGRRGVQARIGEECHGGRIGEPRAHQGVLTLVITDDDGLARRDTLFSERHDEVAEVSVGAVKAGLMEVAFLAAGGTSPHPRPSMCTLPRCSRPSTRATRRTTGGIDRTRTGTWLSCAYDSRARSARWSMNRTADMSKTRVASSGAGWILCRARLNAAWHAASNSPSRPTAPSSHANTWNGVSPAGAAACMHANCVTASPSSRRYSHIADRGCWDE